MTDTTAMRPICGSCGTVIEMGVPFIVYRESPHHERCRKVCPHPCCEHKEALIRELLCVLDNRWLREFDRCAAQAVVVQKAKELGYG